MGELVLAFNEEIGEVGYYPVTATWAHLDPVVVELTIDSEVVWTTPEHPFYTVDGGWETVLELQVGEEIRQADGSTGVVEGVVYHAQPQMMYNMTVATAHTYFVGDGHWLVHNACRELTAIELGIENSVEAFKATISVHNNRATIAWDYVETKGRQIDFFSAFENAKNLARQEGATELLIVGTFADARFMDVMSRRYDIVSRDGIEYLLIHLE